MAGGLSILAGTLLLLGATFIFVASWGAGTGVCGKIISATGQVLLVLGAITFIAALTTWFI